MKNFVLLCVVLIVCLGVGEGALRVTGFQPREVRINPFFVPGTETTWSVPDAELGWINKEGTSVAIEGDHVPMTFWSFGRRATRAPSDATLPTELAGDHIPVMIVGGSNLQSYGVRDEESFPYLLSQRFPALSFENFGTGGYSTVQALMLMDRAYQKFYTEQKPRLILLAFDDAHILRNVADQSWVFAISDPEGRYVAPPHYRMKNGAFNFRPFRTIGYWPLERRSALVTALHNVWLKSIVYNTADEALAVTRKVVEQMAAYAKENGVLFAAVTLDDRGQSAAKVFEGMDFPYKDCSGLERTNPAEYMLKEGSHPNPKLHAHLAECIGDWLDSEILPKLQAQ